MRLTEVCAAFEALAPTRLAQDWDNVGLLAGDPDTVIRRVLLCIDLTPAVVEEAARQKTDLVLAYHPPIFRPITSLRADSSGTETIMYTCIRRNIAVYAMHTALDAAEGGTNDVMASLCGVDITGPIEWVEDPAVDQYKLVTFVPPAQVERVASAVFAAGAGRIGDYTQCSYRLAGQGTFFGGDSTQPAIGRRGQLERVDEIRLETIVPATALSEVVPAMIRAHPYEEPAFDVYPLKRPIVRGIGRVGRLPRPTTLVRLARKLERATGAAAVQIIGEPDRTVSRAVIVVGAAGSIPFRASLQSDDVIVTGEVRHHDALRIARTGCAAVALGHWASERPVLSSLVERLGAACPGLTVTLSEADRDPFQVV
jgi:dinuclear metal center YbgI/SA1388 family protein